jgi:hypothetical protein
MKGLLQSFLLVWVIVLALHLPHGFILALFWFFVAFLSIGVLFLISSWIVGAVWAWRNFKRRHGL